MRACMSITQYSCTGLGCNLCTFRSDVVVLLHPLVCFPQRGIHFSPAVFVFQLQGTCPGGGCAHDIAGWSLSTPILSWLAVLSGLIPLQTLQPQYWYFEVVELLKKVLIASVGILFMPETATQVCEALELSRMLLMLSSDSISCLVCIFL